MVIGVASVSLDPLVYNMHFYVFDLLCIRICVFLCLSVCLSMVFESK